MNEQLQEEHMAGMMWHYDQPENGTLQVHIDAVGRPVNALSRAGLQELEQLVQHVRQSKDITAVVFRSSKPGNFIAGADVTELKDLDSEQAALEISQLGQRIFQQVEDLAIPTIALISGACLGGGLEFAMACRYRIADDDRKTLLGLPEVKLGLIPGWGGTVRLPRLIGFIDALPMILTGKMLNGYQARSRGLVHDVVPSEALPNVAATILQTLHKSATRAAAEAKLFRVRKQPFLQRTIKESGLAKRYALKQAEKQVREKTHGHYPAPQTAIDVLRGGLGQEAAARFAAESAAVARLAEQPVTTELMRLFFLQEDAKKPPQSLNVAVDANSIQRGAVIGAGAMGAGIALLMAKRGIWTRLKDLKPEFVAGGMRTIRKLLKSDVKRKRLTKLEATQALDHLSPATDYRGLKHADIVIEAVIEDLEIKRQVFHDLAEASNPQTVLATNTSSLLVDAIGKDTPHPERVVGLHFFNPPHQMPLVEVIRTERTSPEALATALALVSRIGKTHVVVGDCAGFLVNRLLSPYMNEAGYLLAEVADPLEIERAAIEFGMPMGPLELTDLVGVNVAAHVAHNMFQAYGERMQPAPLWDLLQEVGQGKNKAATGLFAPNKRGKKLRTDVARAVGKLRKTQAAGSGKSSLSRSVIVERLIYPIINEAARCLEEGVAEKADDIDLAMVFGTGFAPFRGGPLRYADSIGIEKIVTTLEGFAAQHPRLAPCDALRQLSQQDTGFNKQAGPSLSSAVA